MDRALWGVTEVCSKAAIEIVVYKSQFRRALNGFLRKLSKEIDPAVIVVKKRGVGVLYAVMARSIYQGLTEIEKDKSEKNRMVRS